MYDLDIEKLTPMMKQYIETKKKHKDSILFFRLGDFYEMFFEDAILASKELDLTLTARQGGIDDKIPMCGVPHHVSDVYINRLVSKGYKVAICDQLEDPKHAKTIVKRGVVKIVTPGTITDQNALARGSNNYLCSIYIDAVGLGISYADYSTGEINILGKMNAENIDKYLLNQIGIIAPSEIILNDNLLTRTKYIDVINKNISTNISFIEESENLSLKQIKSKLDEFILEGISNKELLNEIHSVIALMNLLEYLQETQMHELKHLKTINFNKANEYMVLDMHTLSNLEIHSTKLSNLREGSLIGVLDKCKTSMGSRMLKRWLEHPLIDIEHINMRHDFIEEALNNLINLHDIRKLMSKIYDIERLLVKISGQNANGKDLLSLRSSLVVIPEITKILDSYNSNKISNMYRDLDLCTDLSRLISISINEECSTNMNDGKLIKKGFNKELDELKSVGFHTKDWILNYEKKLREETKIKNLRIKYNKILGYFIEVTKSNLGNVPEYFIRKQTLVGSERFFTEELKDKEQKILSSKQLIVDLEQEIFTQICEKINQSMLRLQKLSKAIAKIDTLISLAIVADRFNYNRPQMNENNELIIIGGRHPVVEKAVPEFVKNDTIFTEDRNFFLLTGPNMAGKSTFMRQTAIITLMAHIGSFVPADDANISIVDRIFTRIGASDNIYKGESTFMVEMKEVSEILEYASSKSLILLDEVGRGTGTYDGISIAWALIEYIIENIDAKTIFATHYHELTTLESVHESLKNLTIDSTEEGDNIVFLRKVKEGRTNRSYGLEVAKLAGIDKKLIDRADELLRFMESNNREELIDNINEASDTSSQSTDISFNDIKVLKFINAYRNIDINSLTPIDSLKVLSELISDINELKEEIYDFD
ncbi:MAG: DNA mismatch repair protein MutS [Tissierellia bacterium]|nr:DNA mismatch repair protein MutS [Tissierellia bacterium]